jgi:DNA-binding transcriptional MerR regulator
LGFSLAEISHKLPQLMPGDDATALLNLFLREKLSEIDTRIDQLKTLREGLASRIGLDCPMQAG